MNTTASRLRVAHRACICIIIPEILILALIQTKPAQRMRTVEFKISRAEDTFLTATMNDMGSDADTVWRRLKSLDFHATNLGSLILNKQSANNSITLEGAVTLESRFGGTIRLKKLKLIRSGTGPPDRWRVSPEEVSLTFNRRMVQRNLLDSKSGKPGDSPFYKEEISDSFAEKILPALGGFFLGIFIATLAKPLCIVKRPCRTIHSFSA